MAKNLYNKVLPEESFLSLYMKYMNEIETPYAYDFWSGIWLISSILNRDIYVNRPKLPLRLNWYILLIADSGVTRKSTAIKRATEILKAYTLTDLTTRIELLEGKTTGESLEQIVQHESKEYDQANIVLSVSELSRLLGKEKYKQSLPQVLIDLYDSPEYQTSGGTVTGGKLIFKNVYMNLIAACAPSWLARSIHPDLLEGGFASRIMWVVSENRKRVVPWPSVDDNIRMHKLELVNKLKSINTLAKKHNKITISVAALHKYKTWYTNKKINVTPFMAAFEARESDQVLKLAAMLCINDNSWVIDYNHLVYAIKIVNHVKITGSNIFNGEEPLGIDEPEQIEKGVNKLCNVLIKNGKETVSQSDLYQRIKNYMNNEDFNSVMNIMHELEMVQKFEDTSNKVGRNSVNWRATTKIKSIKEIGKLLEIYKTL